MNLPPTIALQLSEPEAAALGHLLAWVARAAADNRQIDVRDIAGKITQAEMLYLAGISEAFAQHGTAGIQKIIPGQVEPVHGDGGLATKG